MSNFTWVHEGPPTRDGQTFTNLISSHQRFENNASLSQTLFQEGARKHDAKQSLPAKGATRAVLCVNNTKEHLKPNIILQQDREQHLCTRTSPTPPHWEGGALENGIRRRLLKCAKDGKINRQTLLLCLVRASPAQLAANIYTQ